MQLPELPDGESIDDQVFADLMGGKQQKTLRTPEC